MADLSERLQRDGARWRAEVDGQRAPATDALLDRVTAVPADARPVPSAALREWAAGRAPLLLSVAAVTVIAVAVGGGIASLTDRHDRHGGPAVLAATAGRSAPASGTTSQQVPPVRTASSVAPASADRSASGGPRPDHRSTAHHGPVRARTSASAQHHPTAPPTHLASRPASQPAASTSPTSPASGGPTAGALPCDPAALAISVSAPTAAGGTATLTVSVLNGGAAACTVSGFPEVRFTGDTTVPAVATGEAAPPVTLASGGSATAQVAWADAVSGACPSYPTVQVAAPGGAPSDLPLDPTAQVCDGSAPVVHPLVAG